MSYIVIGIHGLSNKPEASILEQLWREAMLEGLKKNKGIQRPSLNFTSVYWADVMYDKPEIQPLKQWQKNQPDLFVKKVYNHPGLDTLLHAVDDVPESHHSR